MGSSKQKSFGARSLTWGVLIAAGLFALYFVRLGSYPLIDPDEPVYGQVAKQMAAGDGWLTPHYGDQMWFDKPPLFYWLSGLSASALGPTELASRLPSALLAVGLVLLVYALASYDFGKRAGVFSAVVMATCLQQIVLARAAVTDMTLVFCLTGALYAYRRWIGGTGHQVSGLKSRNTIAIGWMALCGAMTGLGMLAKGPVAPVLLGTAIVIHLCWTGRLKQLASFDALAGILAWALVGLPWYAAMYVLHRGTFVEGFLVANNLTRFLKAEHVGQTGGWYSCLVNFPILLAFFFPWSVFLPQALKMNWRANDGARLAVVWAGVVFVFFSISKTILPTYIFPMYPMAAILIGAMWASAASMDIRACRGVRAGMWAGLVVSVLIAVGAVSAARSKYPEAMQAAVVLGAILAAAMALALAVSWRADKRSRGIWAMGTGMAALAVWLMFGVMPIVATRASTRDLVRRVPRISQANLIEYGVEKPSIFFYTGRRPIRTGDPDEVRRLLAKSDPVFAFRKSRDIPPPPEWGAVRVAQSSVLVVYANKAAAVLPSKRP